VSDEVLQYAVAIALVGAVLLLGYLNRDKLEREEQRRARARERARNPKPDGKTRKGS
jgi:hypothetical protein